MRRNRVMIFRAFQVVRHRLAMMRSASFSIDAIFTTLGAAFTTITGCFLRRRREMPLPMLGGRGDRRAPIAAMREALAAMLSAHAEEGASAALADAPRISRPHAGTTISPFLAHFRPKPLAYIPQDAYRHAASRHATAHQPPPAGAVT